jgi:predicted aspartyl protease
MRPGAAAVAIAVLKYERMMTFVSGRVVMRTIGLSFAFTLGLASGAVAQTPAPAALPAPAVAVSPEDAAEIAAAILAASQDSHARMTVPVMIDGKGPYNFVVDTGSERTAIAEDLALQLGLPKGKPVMVHAANASERRDTGVVHKLQVGQGGKGARVEAVLLARQNISVDGMIGIDLLRKQQIVMDFKGAKLAVEPAKKEKFDPNAVVVAGRSLYGQLILADVKVRGQPIYVVIDSGGENTVANTALAKMLLRNRPESPDITITGATGAQTLAKSATLPDVLMGGIVIRNLTVAFADLSIFDRLKLSDRPTMLLGMDVLRKFDRVAVDFERKRAAFNVAADTPAYGSLFSR